MQNILKKASVKERFIMTQLQVFLRVFLTVSYEILSCDQISWWNADGLKILFIADGSKFHIC